ncbi:hypothetical protein E1H12_17815 [Geitlerinema sp. P-1104]|nr:hypothetical protein [Geitlerinema sp. P-1104]NMG60322.1 hypothetical protein [Geitlerinema sp. P-1104]
MEAEIESRLAQSLHHKLAQKLSKTLPSERLKVSRNTSVKVGETGRFEPLPQRGILDIFYAPSVDGKLLLLGKPGSGKTTTLLELADALLNRAKLDVSAPVPIILELSEWQPITTGFFWNKRQHNPSISSWIFGQLEQWGISKGLSNEWPRNRDLIFLLDGLDDLPLERRSQCIEYLNDFLANDVDLVVCDWQETDEDTGQRLNLNGTLWLEDVTSEEMTDYFATLNLENLWSEVKNIEHFVNSINRPLFLSIISLIQGDLDIDEWKQCKTKESCVDYLLTNYQKIMLGDYLSKDDDTPRKDFQNLILKSLIVIANYLNSRKQWFTVNTLDVIPFLRVIHKEHQWYLFIALLWTPFAYLFFRDMEFTESSNFLMALVVVFTTLFSSIFEVVISAGLNLLIWFPLLRLDLVWITPSSSYLDPLSSLQYLGSQPRKWLPIFNKLIGIWIVTISLPFVGIAWLLSLPEDYLGLISFGILVLSFVMLTSYIAILVFFKRVALRYYSNKFKNHCQQKLYTSLYTMMVTFLAGVILSSLTLLIFRFIIQIATINPNDTSLIFVMFSFISLVFTLYFALIWAGGSQVIKYRVFRLILGFSGQLPWNITRFLDDCTESLILQRVGNRYRFIHRLVQEHFANLPIQD